MEVNEPYENAGFPILDDVEAQSLDALSINEKNIESRLLMGWAGYAIFSRIRKEPWFLKAGRIHFLLGGGNNGGDGYVLAWHILSATQKKVSFWQLSEPKTDDAGYFYRLCLLPGCKERIEISSLFKLRAEHFQDGDNVVDAVFGIGLSKPISEDLQEVFHLVNLQKEIKRLSIDIASGVYANGNVFSHEAFMADYTFSLGAFKIGQLIEPGILYSGDSEVLPIGFFPDGDFLNLKRKLLMTGREQKIAGLRKQGGHKYDSGSLTVLGGSESMEGAAVMASRAFLALGGGLVRIYSTSPQIGVALNDNPEFMVASCSNIAEAESFVLESLTGRLKKQALVIGVGLREKLSESFWKKILVSEDLNVVIDGSGLGQVFAFEKFFRENSCQSLVLTPHRGEAEKILGRSLVNVRKDALEISRRYNADVYLKGPGGIVITRESGRGSSKESFDKEPLEIYLNSRHYELAVGGSGDVLSGVMANFILREAGAVGIEKALAVYLKAAQITVEGKGNKKDFLTPSGLIENLQKAFIELA